MTSTYDFYSCYQKSGQPFAEWKAELCEKLRHCAFTTSASHRRPQDRALRDMYVIGTNSNKVRQALLKEQDPDLETTEKIVQLAERLEEDVRHFSAPNNHNDYSVAKLHNHTGTFNTIISIYDWCKLGSPTIHPSQLELKCYSGTRIKIKGECYVTVQYQNKNFQL
ncbi:unnamed protein product, partial [Rotaria socialis]